MGLFRELTSKPWLIDPSKVEGLHDHVAFIQPDKKVGLRVFLCVVTVIFTLITIAYVDRMSFHNWRSVPEPWVLWFNTAMLIASSLAMQWASNNTRRGNMSGVRDGLILGGLLTFGFLIGQSIVWRQLVEMGFYANSNSANAFFYLLTALHGLHLLGGLVAWWRSVSRMWRGATVDEMRLSVELCTTYWHYLLLIWLILFGLLLFS